MEEFAVPRLIPPNKRRRSGYSNDGNPPKKRKQPMSVCDAMMKKELSAILKEVKVPGMISPIKEPISAILAILKEVKVPKMVSPIKEPPPRPIPVLIATNRLDQNQIDVWLHTD